MWQLLRCWSDFLSLPLSSVNYDGAFIGCWKWPTGFESETYVGRQNWSAGHKTENLRLVPSLVSSGRSWTLFFSLWASSFSWNARDGTESQVLGVTLGVKLIFVVSVAFGINCLLWHHMFSVTSQWHSFLSSFLCVRWKRPIYTKFGLIG